MPIVFNIPAWNAMVEKVIDEEAVPRCRKIADACNRALEERGHPTHKESDQPGYIVGVDGGDGDEHQSASSLAALYGHALEGGEAAVRQKEYSFGSDKTLQLHAFRSTVITKTNEAMVDNAEHNTLIYNMGEAAGDL